MRRACRLFFAGLYGLWYRLERTRRPRPDLSEMAESKNSVFGRYMTGPYRLACHVDMGAAPRERRGKRLCKSVSKAFALGDVKQRRPAAVVKVTSKKFPAGECSKDEGTLVTPRLLYSARYIWRISIYRSLGSEPSALYNNVIG